MRLVRLAFEQGCLCETQDGERGADLGRVLGSEFLREALYSIGISAS
jgi:hypothetical protein